MSSMSFPRSAHVYSIARIDNGRSVHDDADFVLYDVMIPISELVNGSNEILCALTYAPNYDEPNLLPGFYRICAKVVNFRANVVMPSPMHDESEFCLMGDLITVSPPITPITSLCFEFPAFATIKGKVFAVQRDINTFTMTVRQYNDGSQSYARLIVRALMGFQGDYGETSAKRLPTRDDFVSFTGVVAAVNHDVLLVVVNTVSAVSSSATYAF